MGMGATLCLSRDDLAFLCNAISEAWEAVRGSEIEFYARTGEKYDRANQIRVRFERMLRECEQQLPISNDGKGPIKKLKTVIGLNDLRVLCSATRMTLGGIEAWEFQTRTGRTPEEAATLLADLETRLKDGGAEKP